MQFAKLSAAVALALVVASPALADPPKPAASAAAKAEGKVEKAGDKAKEGAEKAKEGADKAADKADKAKDEAKSELKADKDATKKKAKEERDELKGKVTKALKGKAMHPSLKQELRRHAQRLARLERIQLLAKDGKDDDSADRVKKLIDKENERHEKWMSNFDPEKAGSEKGGGK